MTLCEDGCDSNLQGASILKPIVRFVCLAKEKQRLLFTRMNVLFAWNAMPLSPQVVVARKFVLFAFTSFRFLKTTRKNVLTVKKKLKPK